MTPEAKQRVMEQLKIDEGVVHESTWITSDYPTVGIGHLILKTDPEHGMQM